MRDILIFSLLLGLSAGGAKAATISPSTSPGFPQPVVNLQVIAGNQNEFIEDGDTVPASFDLADEFVVGDSVARASGLAAVSGGLAPAANTEALSFVDTGATGQSNGIISSAAAMLEYIVGVETTGLSTGGIEGPFTVPVTVTGFVSTVATVGTPTDVVFDGIASASASAIFRMTSGETNSTGDGTDIFTEDGPDTLALVQSFAGERTNDPDEFDPGERIDFTFDAIFNCNTLSDCSTLAITLSATSISRASASLPDVELGATSRAMADPIFTITDPLVAEQVRLVVHPNMLTDSIAVPLPPSIALLAGALGLLTARARRRA